MGRVMEVSAAVADTVKYRRWLPYYAVLRTDIRQTLRSWVFRFWVGITILSAAGFLLYRFGLHREAGMEQTAALHTADLFRGISLGSLALIVVMTVSSISSERGTLADSVLSRGISRYQYFLAKLHARTITITATFALMATVMLGAFHFLLTDDLTTGGCVAAIVTLSALLAAVTALGVTVGALTNSTVVGITVLWVLLYGSGILMTLLPAGFPTPEKAWSRLPHVLRGQYHMPSLVDWVAGGLIVSLAASVIGMIFFARKDV